MFFFLPLSKTFYPTSLIKITGRGQPVYIYIFKLFFYKHDTTTFYKCHKCNVFFFWKIIHSDRPTQKLESWLHMYTYTHINIRQYRPVSSNSSISQWVTLVSGTIQYLIFLGKNVLWSFFSYFESNFNLIENQWKIQSTEYQYFLN